MKLFEPGKIGRLSLKNRIAMGPMGIGALAEPDGRLSQRGIDYYVARAKGGVGLIITGLFRVHRWAEQPKGKSFVRHVMTDDRLYIARLSEFADAVHDYGARVCVQLTAGVGRVASPEYLSDAEALAPSALPCFHDPSRLSRAMTIEEIKRLVNDFEFAARVVRDAGIDAIELHGHEGYLLDQFKTALWNRRTDEYGGSLENRLRFPIDLIEAIKRGAGNDFPIIYRYGLKHYLQGGREADEGLEIARRLEAAGVAAFDVDAGCYETWYWPHPPTTQPPGCMVDLAARVKSTVKVPVMAVGKLGYPKLAEQVLEEGKADFIILARQLLADPDWPNKVRAGNLEDIRPCIGDHECNDRVVARRYISCGLNPTCGMEREFEIVPAQKKKTVLVVGGGPGGMEAARVAALRGHKVILLEKSNALGGNLIPASVPDFKADYRDLIRYFSTQVRKLGVEIRLGTEATPGMIEGMKCDVVFVATGATPVVPDIPGLDKSSAIAAIEVLMGRKVGGRALIVGGGVVGCETALYLAQQGKGVTIVARHGAALDMNSANRQHMLKLLGDAGATILTNTAVLRGAYSGLTVTDQDGAERNLKADDILFAVGLKSNDELVHALQPRLPEVHAVGDCVEPRKVANAVWEAFRTARLI